MLNRFKPAKTPVGHWHDGLLLLCITCLLLIAIVPVASNEYTFAQTAARANGMVIRQNHGKHHVQIGFTTASGTAIEYAQNGHISYETGEQVTVLYDPKEPRLTASTDAVGALWGGTIDLSLFALGAFALAMLAIFFPRYFWGPFSKNEVVE